MEYAVVGKHTRLCAFIPDIGTHRHGMALSRTAWVRPAPVYTNTVWPPLRLASVAQKNRPLTTLSSNVQSCSDLPIPNNMLYKFTATVIW